MVFLCYRCFLENIIFFNYRTWKQATILTIAIYFLIQGLMRWNQIYNENQICKADKFSDWTWYANALQAGGFISILFVQFSLFITTQASRRILSCTIATSCISFLAGCSSVLTLIWNWGGVCEDAYG